MLFHTQAFVLGVLPPVLVLYYLVAGSPLLRKLLLVATSVLFYALWDWRFVPLLAGLAVATWIIAALHLRGYRKSLPALGVALNLGVLIWYKYTDFLGASASWLLGHTWTPLALMLPLGISFFVFQKISYLLDLRNGDRHGYSLLDFCLFVSFFPQLIAGPLVRHYELIPQLSRNPRGPAMWENLSRGAALFAIGLAKKLALADMLALIADPVFAKTLDSIFRGTFREMDSERPAAFNFSGLSSPGRRRPPSLHDRRRTRHCPVPDFVLSQSRG